MEQINVLREHNKDLLKQLKQEKEAFARNGGRVEEAELQVPPDRSSAQAALAPPHLLSAGNLSHLHPRLLH